MLQWLGYNRTPGDWYQEVEWLNSRIHNSRPQASILGFYYAAVVYQIWAERNARRFKNIAKESIQRLQEIAVQVHSAGQHHLKWRPRLLQLNKYPS